MIPKIETSTKQEREAYIEKMFQCISDCDMCGLCFIYKGDPLILFQDYIEGKATFEEVNLKLRK